MVFGGGDDILAKAFIGVGSPSKLPVFLAESVAKYTTSVREVIRSQVSPDRKLEPRDTLRSRAGGLRARTHCSPTTWPDGKSGLRSAFADNASIEL